MLLEGSALITDIFYSSSLLCHLIIWKCGLCMSSRHQSLFSRNLTISYMTGELKFWYLSFQESELLAVGCHIVVLIWGDLFLGEIYTFTYFGLNISFQWKEWLLWLGLFQFFAATCMAFFRGASHAIRTVCFLHSFLKY